MKGKRMKNEAQQQPNFTSSKPMEALPRFEQVLALGRKLVEEFGREPSVDTLGRWMAHYVAELMNAAENASPQEREVTKKRCFDAILELWSHRAELPSGKRPFESIEPIMRALESLDPDDEFPRYFRNIRNRIEEEEGASQIQNLIAFVEDLDSIAKILIGYTLSEAARSTLDTSREWVALAENAGAEFGVESVVIRFVSGGASNDKEDDKNVLDRERLQDRITRLEAFTKVAALVCDDFKDRLKLLSAS